MFVKQTPFNTSRLALVPYLFLALKIVFKKRTIFLCRLTNVVFYLLNVKSIEKYLKRVGSKIAVFLKGFVLPYMH